jgi:ABC-type glycerol-3-phosphate transport system permease component
LAVPWTVAGSVFYGLFNVHGVADQLSQDLFGTGSSFMWLFHPRWAFAIVVAAGIWKGAPWCYLLLLGALSACPEEVLEAARVDGARGFAFWGRVVLPSVRPMLVFVVVLRLLAEAQAYNAAAILTNGGPSFPGATSLVGFYANKLAFGYYNFGEASAMGTLTGAVLVVIAIAGYRLAYPRRLPRRRLVPLGDPAPPPAARSAAPSIVAHPLRRATQGRRPADEVVQRGLRASLGWATRARRGLLAVMVVAVLVPFAGEAPGWLGTHELAGTNWAQVEGGLWNTLALSAATLAGTLALAVPAAYVLAYRKSRWQGLLFVLVLFTLAVPGVIFVYPQYQEIVWLGLVNTRLGVLVLYITANLPLAIFFLRPAFAAVPRVLVDAMRVDGASTLTVVRKLMLRYAASTLVAVSVLVVVWVWGEYPIAEAVLSPNNQGAFTLPLLLFEGMAGNPNFAYLISLGAPLVLFLATQRFFRRGLVSGSLL